MIGKKGLLSSFPYCVHRKWTEEQGPELSNLVFRVLCIAFLYAVGIFVPFLDQCVVFVSPRGRNNT